MLCKKDVSNINFIFVCVLTAVTPTILKFIKLPNTPVTLFFITMRDSKTYPQHLITA